MVRNLKIAPADPQDIDAQDIDAPLEPVEPPRPPAGNRLGNILVELGRIESRHVDLVLAQQSQNPRRFGDLAIALGLVVRADIDLALARQFDMDFQPATIDADAVALPSRLGDAQSEVLRAVRSQLVLRWFGNDPEQRTLAVVSHGADEGRSHVCANLAVQLSQMDEDTLVIDADLRKPSLHTLFGMEAGTGLTEYLSRDVLRAPIRAVPGKPRLHLLSAGQFKPGAQPLLERRQFGLLLGTLAQRYAFVLIDTPPAAQFSEALTAAVRASGCLLVTRRNRTRMADAQRLADQLTRHSVVVLGAVINER